MAAPANLITLAVTARNEEATIEDCLRSLLTAVAYAERRRPIRFDVVVVLDECDDRTGPRARGFDRVRTLTSRGGIVEAQRKVADATPLVLLCDADITVEPDTLLALVDAMTRDPSLRVAYPPKRPRPPTRTTWLARALYAYNRSDGFQTRRYWFSGKLFAIRGWAIPRLEQLAPRLAGLPRDNFYDFHAGMRVDDIYLSRSILAAHGPAAIEQTDRGQLWFRAPETFEGMYRTYRRMRMELTRIDRLFPELQAAHRRYGTRGYDRAAVRRAAPGDRWAWRYFRAVLQLCKLRYRLERAYYRRVSSTPCDPWPPVVESKVAIRSG